MYLVLGGTGLIGQALVKRISQKNRVRVLARHESNAFDGMDVEMVCADFAKADMSRLLDGVDIVFHLISSSVPMDGVAHLEKDITEDFLPTLRLLEAMAQKGVKSLYYISSGGTVYGDKEGIAREEDALNPKCSYGLGKVYLEQCLSMYRRYCGIDAYCLRVGNPYGIDREGKKQGIIPIFAKRIMDGEVIDIWGDGTNERDYIFIEEVIDAIEAVERYEGQERIFNIGTGIGTSTIHIVSLLSEELQKNVNIRFLPARLCDVKKARMDTALIERECQWRSRISIRQGIQLYLDEWRKTW